MSITASRNYHHIMRNCGQTKKVLINKKKQPIKVNAPTFAYSSRITSTSERCSYLHAAFAPIFYL
jgi:hypothetical protein